MNRGFYLILLALGFCLSSNAQTENAPLEEIFSKEIYFNPMERDDVTPFSHLQIGASVGPTGIGGELVTPISKNLRLRAGFYVMPNISFNRKYEMASAGSGEGESTYEDMKARVGRLCQYLGDMVGAPVDGYVEMEHTASFYNGRLLVDWYPFKKKHLHFTGGFYLGPKQLGYAFNALSESNTLVAINMYNKMYDQISKLGPYEYPYFQLGDYYIELDPFTGQKIKDGFNYYGRLAVQLGVFPDGSPNYVKPDENGVLSAQAEVWAFKPYVGVGWSTDFGYDHRWTFSADCGAMIWGTPHVYCTNVDGQTVDLVHDVSDVVPPVGTYIKILKHLPVCPNIEFRLAYTIF